MESYAMAGVGEYLVWRPLEQGLDWFVLEDAEYTVLKPDARGLIRSNRFPGLVLDTDALLAQNGAKVLATLQRGILSAVHRTFVASLR